MPIRKDVKEVLDLCKSLGLDPIMESGSGHYKVRDPNSGVYVFGISSSPSDPNFRWMIMRHLRRLGLLKDGSQKSKTHKYKQKAAIDLSALRKAQDAAASRGERVPTLDDLEDSTEFFTRIKRGSGRPADFTEEAMEEAIELMATRTDRGRVNYIRGRLKKYMDEHGHELEDAARKRMEAAGKRPTAGMGRGSKAEFVRIAMHEVAPKRNMRAWASEGSGAQTMSKFLGEDGEKVTLQIWTADLIDATLDHLEGLKWGEIDENRKKTVTPPPTSQFQASTPEPQPKEEEVTPYPETERKWEDRAVPENNHIRERYAEALLEILKKEGSQTSEPVLARLDRLAGIDLTI